MFDNRNYLIINSDEANIIDFNQVLETSVDTLRFSVDGSKTFIKWDGNQPEFINSFTFVDGPYSHEEILDILSTEEWSAPEEEI